MAAASEVEQRRKKVRQVPKSIKMTTHENIVQMRKERIDRITGTFTPTKLSRPHKQLEGK